MFLTTTNEAFTLPGNMLGVALASASGRESCGEKDFLAALSTPGLYMDFTISLPLSVISGFVGEQMSGQNVRALLLSVASDGTVDLYFHDGQGNFSRCATAVTAVDLLELVSAYEPGNAAFAYENSELDVAFDSLARYSLFLGELPSIPVLSAAKIGRAHV